MITAEMKPAVNNKAMMTLYGPSTEDKPVGTFDRVEIANGSAFLEIDTQNVLFYNEESQSWT